MRTVPARRGRAPKIASQNSLRPEPISPARQTISPERRRIDASSTSGGAAMPSASSTTWPGVRRPASREKWTSRPTIRRISSSVDVSATRRVPASLPSFSTVTVSQSAKISARRCDT